jgi:hypothetical protein
MGALCISMVVRFGLKPMVVILVLFAWGVIIHSFQLVWLPVVSVMFSIEMLDQTFLYYHGKSLHEED